MSDSKLAIPIGVSNLGLKGVLKSWFRSRAHINPLTIDDVAKKTASKKQTIQRQMPFLLQIGILEKTNDTYQLTEDGRYAAQYSEYSQDVDFAATLNRLVSRWSEIQSILDYLEDAKEVHVSTLKKRIMMYSERAPTDRNVEMGADALIDLLTEIGVLTKIEHKIRILRRTHPGVEPVTPTRIDTNEMWIDSIRIKNIKSIIDTTFTTRKMNIFIGANGSGKSSILHALLSLRNIKWERSHAEGVYSELFLLQRKGSQDSMYIELEGHVPSENANDRFEFRVTITPAMSFFWQLCLERNSIGLCDTSMLTKAQDLRPPLSLYKGLEPIKEFVEKTSQGMSQLNEMFHGNMDFDESEKSSSEPFTSMISFLEDNHGNIVQNFQERRFLTSWNQVLPEFLRNDEYENIRLSYLKVRPILSTYIDSFEFVPVLRGFLSTEYEQRKAPSDRIPDDLNYVLYILNKMVYKDDIDPLKMEKLKRWAERFGIRDFEAVITRGPRIEPRGSIFDGKATLPVSLYGFGLNQSLALMAKCIYSEDNSPILIEEPEIHLHPEYQAQIADFLIESMKEGHQLFIATHSEHLIGRIQRRIAEGILKQKDVQILWVVHDSEKGTQVEEVEMDDSGIIHEGLQSYLSFLEEEMRATERTRREHKE